MLVGASSLQVIFLIPLAITTNYFLRQFKSNFFIFSPVLLSTPSGKGGLKE